jgi:hypothetical protein
VGEKTGLGAELASRTIVDSVDKLGGPSTEIAKHLKKFAMIAADVGVNDFNFITLPLLRKLDVDVTNYGTRSDGWLDMSARVWDQRRLGQGGDETYKDPFITSIDLDRGDFGHHLLGVRDLVEDLGDWLTDNKAPYEDSRGRRWVPRNDPQGVTTK